MFVMLQSTASQESVFLTSHHDVSQSICRANWCLHGKSLNFTGIYREPAQHYSSWYERLVHCKRYGRNQLSTNGGWEQLDVLPVLNLEFQFEWLFHWTFPCQRSFFSYLQWNSVDWSVYLFAMDCSNINPNCSFSILDAQLVDHSGWDVLKCSTDGVFVGCRF